MILAAIKRLPAGVMAAALALLVMTGCGSQGPAQSTSRLTNVSHIAQLRTLFNTHPGTPRLILLASPT